MLSTREREPDDTEFERSPKRTRVDHPPVSENPSSGDDVAVTDLPASEDTNLVESQNLLPPSHILLGIPPPTSDGHILRILERDVGISEYVGRDIRRIDGIIKQRYRSMCFTIEKDAFMFQHRFTDFLVNEVDLDNQVVHIKCLGMPESKKTIEASGFLDVPMTSGSSEVDVENRYSRKIEGEAGESSTDQTGNQSEALDTKASTSTDEASPLYIEGTSPSQGPSLPHDPWPDHFTATLANFLSEDAISRVKTMYLEGPEPPRISDNGWGGLLSKNGDGGNRGQDRSGRGKRGRGRGGAATRSKGPSGREDERKVLSDVCIQFLLCE
jgi:tRNA pseudouridine13 synthase